MKGYGLVKCYFPWTAQHYCNTESLVYAHTLYAERTELVVKPNTCNDIIWALRKCGNTSISIGNVL